MKGKMKRKQHGFKVGNTQYLKKSATEGSKVSTNNVKYLRLTKEQHKLVTEDGPGVDLATSGRGQGQRYGLLRPLVSQKSELEAASVTSDKR